MNLCEAIYRIEEMIETSEAYIGWSEGEDIKTLNKDIEALSIARKCMGVVHDLQIVKGILKNKELGVYDDVE